MVKAKATPGQRGPWPARRWGGLGRWSTLFSSHGKTTGGSRNDPSTIARRRPDGKTPPGIIPSARVPLASPVPFHECSEEHWQSQWHAGTAAGEGVPGGRASPGRRGRRGGISGKCAALPAARPINAFGPILGIEVATSGRRSIRWFYALPLSPLRPSILASPQYRGRPILPQVPPPLRGPSGSKSADLGFRCPRDPDGELPDHGASICRSCGRANRAALPGPPPRPVAGFRAKQRVV